MLSDADAKRIMTETCPDGFRIVGPVSFKGNFVFQAFDPEDEVEGTLDPYFVVDGKTGEVRDFSLILEGGPEVNDLFKNL